MIKLELIENHNGKRKKVVHEQDFVSARKVREALVMQDQFDQDEITGEANRLDKMVEFAASLFDDVTTDAIYDGLSGPEALPTLNRVIGEVMGHEKKPQVDESAQEML